MNLNVAFSKRNCIAPGYAPITICISDGLETLLQGNKITVPQGYITDAIQLFRKAHHSFRVYGFAVKDDPVDVNGYDLLYIDFLGEAYGRAKLTYTRCIDALEKKVREGLFLTECLPTVFLNQEIPESSVEDYRELQKVYRNLYEIARREHPHFYYACSL